MSLLVILLYVVAVLTVLTGFSVFCGTNKQSRLNTAWFLIATIGSAVWSSSIATFMSLSETQGDAVHFIVVGIIAGITITDVALLGYTGWSSKIGKILLILFAICGSCLIGVLAFSPEVFYEGYNLIGDNQLFTVKGWFFYALIVYFTLITFCFTTFLSNTIKKIKNKNVKRGQIVFFVGLSIGGILALIFDLLLLKDQPNYIWIGPMAVSITILGFYYSVVRCRSVVMSATWMKMLSYIIILTFGAFIYVLIFYLIFSALFGARTPAFQILLLNLLMAAIILCLLPALREVFTFLNSFIATKEIDIGYVTKKMNKLTKRTLDLKELAGFMADHLHFEYVGFLINGRLYGSGSLDISSDDLVDIEHLKTPARGVWQEINPKISKACMENDIKYIADLFNTKNEVFGQVIFGRSLTKRNLDRKDLIEIGMVIDLAATIINGEKKN